MSWREVDAWMAGAVAREEAKWRRTAQLGAWMLSPYSKKRLTGDDLYKPRAKEAPKVAHPEHVTEIVHKLASIPETAWQPWHP